MKILVVTGIFPPDIGGPATYVPLIARALKERGHDITVFTLSDDGGGTHDDDPYKVVRFSRRIWRPWRIFFTVFKIIKEGWDRDVLFVNGLALESIVANFFLRKPLVMKVVGDLVWEKATNSGWITDDFEVFQRKSYSLGITLMKSLRAWWTRKSDLVIVPSKYLGEIVKGWGVRATKIVVIYNSFECERHTEIRHVPLKTNYKLVTVGRLVRWKGNKEIIEVIASYQDIGLVIIGDGPERESLEQLSQTLQMSERVYFAGQKSKAEMLGLMEGCDAFVLNSTYEGLPHIVLETMQIGLPVIATNVGGIPEVVVHGKTGLLVEPRDNASLDRAIRLLLTSPNLREDLAYTAKKMLTKFEFSNMLLETERVLLASLKGTSTALPEVAETRENDSTISR